MSSTFTRRLLARPGLRSPIISTIPARSSPLLRALSTTPANADFSSDTKTTATNLFNRSAAPRRDARMGSGSGGAMANLSKVLGNAPASVGDEPPSLTALSNEAMLGRRAPAEEEPYHFHVYSHKHNTHVTVTKPNRDAIISLSCGNIGFKKARRKQYDAAYQLTVYVLERLYDAGWDQKIEQMEVILKGFGTGREAATKVLLGSEGARLKDKIVRVADATDIKFGGTRSPNPRRI